MEGDSPYLGCIIFILLVLIAAVFYGFGAAIQELNEAALQKKAEEGNKKAECLLHIRENPAGFINTIQIVVTLISISVGAYEVTIFGKVFRYFMESYAKETHVIFAVISYILVTLVFAFFLLVFGVMSPKRFASRHSEKWAYSLVGIVTKVSAVFWPFNALLTLATRLFTNCFGVEMDYDGEDVTEEEIISMVNEGQEQGVLLAREAEMITNIVELGDKEAKDIMTHRKDIVAIDGSMTLEEVLDFILEEKNSRFPVYENDVDHIIGILHMKDAMKYHTQERLRRHSVCQIEGLVREAVFVPETKDVGELFKAMQSQKMHMVIVVDEYGQTSGLIAMEDILEEIVGNILDEYDEEDELIEKQSDGSYIINGMADLDDVAETLGISYDEDTYDTLNGFLISKLARIPEEDEQFEIKANGYSFKALSVHNKIIEKVLVTKLMEEQEAEQEDKDA